MKQHDGHMTNTVEQVPEAWGVQGGYKVKENTKSP